MASAVAFAFAPLTHAKTSPEGGPSAENAPAATANQASPENAALSAISIHSAGNVLRGKTGSFVLKMSPALMLGGMYVNYKVSGTAVPGVDYVALRGTAFIGKSGYGVITLKTLADPRGASNNKNYTVIVTLEPGPGYAVGKPSSATIWISATCALEACW